MSYNTSDVCQLGEGYFSMKVNGESVVVNSANDVMADPTTKPTRFYIKKFQSGDVCTYVIYNADKSKYAEYSEGWTVYMTDSGAPRNWTITLVKDSIYTIQPGPPSINAWTTPYDKSGQIYLTTKQTDLPEQEFTITPA
ncbi:hypothetical protein SCLCIDRAFT_1219111 [Scleroderma citrinum Foug A]|uniref:Uncharacterized protein n=1 Tax=Scleroderma citrinum Foug A TaxID=1036808 RepID=A0A0C3DPB9_9AGAM|nr:hypothetical protein SCLCIDRAFT_1219111 [Scleroderma citrinum Foug A]